MNIFATSINCMDGRIQLPIIEYIRKKFNVDHVDIITEPGPNKILAENSDLERINSIKQRVDISVNKHNSQLIAVSGHHDCAGNPEAKDDQIEHIKTAIELINSWGFKAKTIGLWIDDDCKVSEVE